MNLLIIASAVLLASLLHFTIGFADSLILMPVLILYFSSLKANIICNAYGLLIGILICLTIKISKKNIFVTYRDIIASSLGYIIGSLIGYYILKKLIFFHDFSYYIQKILALMLLGYPLLYYFMKKKYNFKLTYNPWSASIAGFFSGLLGILIATNGPPLVIYAHMRKFSKTNFILYLQPTMLLGSFISLLLYQQIYPGAFKLSAYITLLLPLFLLIAYFASKLRNKIHYFDRVIIAVLFITGIAMLF